MDFTLSFRRLSDLAGPEPREGVSGIFNLPDTFSDWLTRWNDRQSRTERTPEQRQLAMDALNPVVIPRNLLVEEASIEAQDHDDFKPFHALVNRLENPFVTDPKDDKFAVPPRPEQIVRQTFFGT